jgi:hypothetical protein
LKHCRLVFGGDDEQDEVEVTDNGATIGKRSSTAIEKNVNER